MHRCVENDMALIGGIHDIDRFTRFVDPHRHACAPARMGQSS
jgi:hypothetical protein